MLVSKTNSIQDRVRLWQAEHSDLDRFAWQQIRWMKDLGRRSETGAAQALERLTWLRRRLRNHFENEQQLSVLLQEARGGLTPELAAMTRQETRDHAHIMDRLSVLIERFRVPHLDGDAWDAALYEFNLIVDLLEQHEEQQSCSMSRLLPSGL